MIVRPTTVECVHVPMGESIADDATAFRSLARSWDNATTAKLLATFGPYALHCSACSTPIVTRIEDWTQAETSSFDEELMKCVECPCSSQTRRDQIKPMVQANEFFYKLPLPFALLANPDTTTYEPAPFDPNWLCLADPKKNLIPFVKSTIHTAYPTAQLLCCPKCKALIGYSAGAWASLLTSQVLVWQQQKLLNDRPLTLSEWVFQLVWANSDPAVKVRIPCLDKLCLPTVQVALVSPLSLIVYTNETIIDHSVLNTSGVVTGFVQMASVVSDSIEIPRFALDAFI